jgi:hypothetical protein
MFAPRGKSMQPCERTLASRGKESIPVTQLREGMLTPRGKGSVLVIQP